MTGDRIAREDGIGHRITGRRTGASNRHHGIGWEALHVAIDDASRPAYTDLLPDEKKESTLAFLDRALDWFARHGVAVERIMTDHGSAYRSHASASVSSSSGLGTSGPEPGPTRRAPTVRQGASFRPACENGPTPAPTNPPPNDAQRRSHGSPAKTKYDHTQLSAENHPPPD